MVERQRDHNANDHQSSDDEYSGALLGCSTGAGPFCRLWHQRIFVRSPKRGGRTPPKTQRRNCPINKPGRFAGCMDANRNVASCIGNSALGRTALFPFGQPFGLAQGGKGAQRRSTSSFLSLDFVISRPCSRPAPIKMPISELGNSNPRGCRRSVADLPQALRSGGTFGAGTAGPR